ncbi:MAG: choloylglycine hydrolase family protein [Legionellaceae bacterium]|nr:choloylglycine hydrolase family protein [Legionellaceae bacterium]
MKQILIAFLCLCSMSGFACTHINLTAKDGSVVVGRSMEFGLKLETNIYTVNRGAKFESKTPDGKPGLYWQAKYGYLALDGFHLFPVSGMNEQGLSFDALYFPGLAEYQTYDANQASEAMPYYLIADYILGNYSNITEIKEALPKLTIYAQALKHAGQDVVFPLHFVVTDKQGQSLAIEFTDGQLHLYDNKIGVFTNSPSYAWQITNLDNYINLSPNAPKPIVKDGMTYNATGQGAGSIGLPGDYTPPGRFVRMAYLVNTAKQTRDARGAVNLAQHILNNVDIPYGAVRGTQGDNSPDAIDSTQWVVIKDLAHHVLYFRSYSDLVLQKIDMSKLEFEPGSPKRSLTLVDDVSRVIDATARFK